MVKLTEALYLNKRTVSRKSQKFVSLLLVTALFLGSMAQCVSIQEVEQMKQYKIVRKSHNSTTQSFAHLRSDVCYPWQLNGQAKGGLLQANKNGDEGMEIIGYVPPGDLAKSGSVQNSKNPSANQELQNDKNGDPKGLKVDLEKKDRQEVKEQMDKKPQEFAKHVGADESQETGGKYADKIAEENHREMLSKAMSAEQMHEEEQTSFFKDAAVFELHSNSQINSVISWQDLPSKKFKTADGKEAELKMGGNSTHQNLLLVYHPKCGHCKALKDNWIHLSQKIQQEKIALNLLAINDGIQGYKKQLPGNLKVEYYPYILLLKNDKEQSAEEFNPQEAEADPQQQQKPPKYEYNLQGFSAFLKDQGVQGFAENGQKK